VPQEHIAHTAYIPREALQRVLQPPQPFVLAPESRPERYELLIVVVDQLHELFAQQPEVRPELSAELLERDVQSREQERIGGKSRR